jgi:PAS domain S-box-containing protein
MPGRDPQLTNELAQFQAKIAALEAELAELKQAKPGRRHYEFMANTSRDFMTLIDRQHVYRAVNQAYCHAHQKSPNEIIGKSVAQVWGEERYLTQVKGYLEACFAGEEARYEGWFEFATLGRRYFDVTYYPYYGDDGSITHAVVVSRDNTRYREIQEELTRSEQRYRLTSDLTSNFTYAFGLSDDGTFRLEWVTDAFTRITGYAPEEVNTRPKWLQLAHPDDFFAAERREQALQTGRMNVSEYRIVTKSGQTRWLRDHIRPIWNRKQHQVVRLYGAVQDITARKEAEAERERFTGLLRTAAHVSRQLNAMLDPEQLLTRIVSLLEDHFQIYPVEVYLLDETGRHLTLAAASAQAAPGPPKNTLIIPLDRPDNAVAHAARNRALEAGPTPTGQKKLDSPLGTSPAVSAVCIPLIEGSAVLGVLHLQTMQPDRFQQIDLDTFEILAGQIATAIHNARLIQLLRLGEERYALASQVGKVGVWDWDLQANTLYVAPNLKALLGYENHEISNQPEAWLNLIHPDDYEAVRTLSQAHLDGLTPQYATEHRMLHRDGSVRWMLSRGMAVKDETGQATRLTGANTDITELKQIEEALQYRIALEAFVTTVSTHFINLPTPEVDSEISNALGIIGKFFGAGFGCLALAAEDNANWVIPYQWQHRGSKPEFARHVNLPVARFEWFMGQLHRFEQVYIPTLADLPPEAQPEQTFFKQHGFESFIAVPLIFTDSVAGILGLGNMGQQRHWSTDNIAPLKLVSQMFVNVLERKRIEEQIQASLKDKEVLLREIHHRVKNNLQIVSSLLYLQSVYAKEAPVQEILRDSHNRIRSMGLIHEILYQSPDLANIDFAGYIHSLVDYLLQAYELRRGSISLNIQIDPIPLNLDTVIPCGLIVTELVSNTLKYAFPATATRPADHAPAIQIALKESAADHVILTISDNGAGLPAGFDIDASDTLGWKLVSRLVEQIKGVLNINQAGGTTVTIEFPTTSR